MLFSAYMFAADRLATLLLIKVVTIPLTSVNTSLNGFSVATLTVFRELDITL